MWKRMLIALALLFAAAVPARADQPAQPNSYSMRAGDFVFVMLANDGRPVVSSLGKPYPSSGMYRDDGSTAPLWKVDFYAFEGQVFPMPDGHHVAHLGPWPETGNYGELAVAFYKDGQALARYKVLDLVRRPESLPRSVSHYGWQKGEARFDAAKGQLALVTQEDETYTFDLATGKMVQGAKPVSRGLSPWWWVGGTLAFLAILWFLNRRMR